MLQSMMQLRSDTAGDGRFGSPRGNRKHLGVDFLCVPGQNILSPVTGKVSKIGYPYPPPSIYRYIQISCTDEYGNEVQHRLFYVEPHMSIARIDAEVIGHKTIIGYAQNVCIRYPGAKGMQPHVHYEIRRVLLASKEYEYCDALFSDQIIRTNIK